MVNWKYIVRYGPCSTATPLMFSNSFYFHHFSPYFRKIPMFDNYFQIGWNHHLALHLFSLRFNAAPTKNYAKCLHTHRQDLMMAGVAARREPFLFTLEGKPGTQFLLGNNWFQEGHLGNQIYCIYIYTYRLCAYICMNKDSKFTSPGHSQKGHKPAVHHWFRLEWNLQRIFL